MSKLKLPSYWDLQAVITAFQEKTTQELYDFFQCPNATSFTRKMQKVFPDKPKSLSYKDYVLELLHTPEKPKWSPKPPEESY